MTYTEEKEKELLKMSEWFYAFNSGSIPKEECVRKMLYESKLFSVESLIEELKIFNVSIGEYIQDLVKKFFMGDNICLNQTKLKKLDKRKVKGY